VTSTTSTTTTTTATSTTVTSTTTDEEATSTCTAFNLYVNAGPESGSYVDPYTVYDFVLSFDATPSTKFEINAAGQLLNLDKGTVAVTINGDSPAFVYLQPPTFDPTVYTALDCKVAGVYLSCVVGQSYLFTTSTYPGYPALVLSPGPQDPADVLGIEIVNAACS
jgi:hypothetical protein